MAQFIGTITRTPARASFIWYIAVIAAGSLALMTPICRSADKGAISPLDAVFTATSATCVTGLAVRSTGHDFSWAGQFIILVMIQLGGVGIMTVTTYVTFQLGTRAGLRQRTLIAQTLGAGHEPDLKWVLAHVLRYAFFFEAAGFLLLSARFWFHDSVENPLWSALFHSISAFCNAGFSLYDDSLMRFQSDPLVNFTIMGLIVCGGIGFPVMFDVSRNWHGPWRDRFDNLSLHSKMMIVGTTVLIVVGFVMFMILEWDGVLQHMSLGGKILVALFHSITPRTAGFNTVEMSALTHAALFWTVLFMIIGAGPCSTGGGLKVSTFSVLFAWAWSAFHGRSSVSIFRRTIPSAAMVRASVTALLFATAAGAALTLLLVLEQSEIPHAESNAEFFDALFEVVSALGTVGLSTGMTSRLTAAGRLIIIVLMFIGRLGPITAFAALARSERAKTIEFAQEEPLIG